MTTRRVLLPEGVAGEKDVNDYRERPDVLKAAAERGASTAVPPIDELRITEEELARARITPTCIVSAYLYADVATISAPGGTGKTTLTLYEMACIALKRKVHGLEVHKDGTCLLLTKEDRREQCVARLREIMNEMGLTRDERRIVLERVLVWDVTGDPLRLVMSVDGNILPTALADNLIDAFRNDPPVIITIDPSISFGADEGMVNTNEQAMITACRKIVRELDCCVRLVAHTGKVNARNATLDQYTSRGGSALSDGARMVAVLQPWTPESDHRPPPGCVQTPGASITILARPKLSYAPANLPMIWIRRDGWLFESFAEMRLSPEAQTRSIQDQVIRFLESEVKKGTRHSKTSLTDAVPNLKRIEARAAVNQLMAMGRIIEAELPKNEQVTSRKTYLTTSAGFGRIPQKGENGDGGITPANSAAAYREKNGGTIPPPIISPFSNPAAETRQDSAGLAGFDPSGGDTDDKH
jgi:RecA-family ATPase